MKKQQTDTYWMEKALILAEKGKIKVRPNPMVGCVIVYGNEIIGEGYHEYYGGPHAEVNAINSVKNPELLPLSTAYVSLEPCAHFGKTPPCANLLVEKKIKRVVIAAKDPNPLVAGKGIEILRNHKIEVKLGVLGMESERLNKKFNLFHQLKRPYITLKFASSKDNFIAKKNGEPIQFSNSESQKMVHELRAIHEGILVGANTIIHDQPLLNTRLIEGPSPIKIIIDPNNRIPKNSKVLEDGEKTLIYNYSLNLNDGKNEWIKLESSNFLKNIIQDLSDKKISSVLVEGGTKTLDEFIKLNLFDELIHIQNNQILAEGIQGPKFNLNLIESKKIGENNSWYYYSTQPKT
ncbi:MAG: Diaminohydroxyphosphoribosylaminopyrimidine deaminase [Bacteroidota bacterium]